VTPVRGGGWGGSAQDAGQGSGEDGLERVGRIARERGVGPSDAKGLRTLRCLHLAPLARFARLHYPETPEGNLALAVAAARILVAPGRTVGAGDVREFVEKEAEHQVSSFRDAKARSRQIGAEWSGGPLARITAPTLVLHGECDPLLRVAAGRDIAAAVPGAHLRTLPGIGHFLSDDTWAVYADELRAHADRAARQLTAREGDLEEEGTGDRRAASHRR
jgi:pimeloyl-ACP methyl ester carboxylesterase